MTTMMKQDAAISAAAPPASASDAGQPRSLYAICEDTRRATCGECWAYPGVPCVTEGGARGYHVARFGRAFRRGLVSERELGAVLRVPVVVSNDTVIWDGAR